MELEIFALKNSFFNFLITKWLAGFYITSNSYLNFWSIGLTSGLRCLDWRVNNYKYKFYFQKWWKIKWLQKTPFMLANDQFRWRRPPLLRFHPRWLCKFLSCRTPRNLNTGFVVLSRTLSDAKLVFVWIIGVVTLSRIGKNIFLVLFTHKHMDQNY